MGPIQQLKSSLNVVTVRRVRGTVIALLLVIGFGGMISGYMLEDSNKPIWEALSGAGASCVTAAALASVMLWAGFEDARQQARELVESTGENLRMPCARRYRLVESAEVVGLSRVYISREVALSGLTANDNFCRHIRQEQDKIFIIGSSLSGFLLDRHFSHVMRIIERKSKKNEADVVFMLTHPLFADFRAAQEGRESKDIGGEIISSLRKIKELHEKCRAKIRAKPGAAAGDGAAADRGRNPTTIATYLYAGTPTCFGICTSSAMLINPYPYGRQAYESPCFEFARGTHAYNLYLQAHFQTQFAGKIMRFDLTEREIDRLQKKLDTYSKVADGFQELFRSSKYGLDETEVEKETVDVIVHGDRRGKREHSRR